MRIELQQLDQIDAYLNGSMNAAARAQFEQELARSAELREMVENQQLIIRTIQRQALRSEIARYGSPSGGWTLLKWLSVGVIVAGIGVGGYFAFFKGVTNDKVSAVLPLDLPPKGETESLKTEKLQAVPGGTVAVADSTRNEADFVMASISAASPFEGGERGMATLKQIESVWIEQNTTPLSPPSKGEINSTRNADVDGLKTWIAPLKQYFDIDPKTGKTIECKEGTLIIVPENAFLDNAGKIIKERVQLEVVEALNVADMLAYNLTTLNDGKHLQSGGMIYVQPKVKGEKVKINPENPLYIEIPTENEVPGMMAWKGKTDASGNINWTDPKPLEKFLTPVRFDLLDFLPAGFEAEVEASLPFRGHTENSKKLTDSLYYALAVTGNKKFVAGNETLNEEEMFRVKKNTYALNGRVIEKDLDEPIAHVKIRIFSFEDRERASRDSAFRLNPIDSVTTDNNGNFTLQNLRDQHVYFMLSHPEYAGYTSPDLILPLNRILTFQPVIKLKRIVERSQTEIAARQVTGSAYKDSVNSCMIDPLSIQTIKTKAFEKTFLATREFEARIQVLHTIQEPQSLLEMYVTNLDRNLWEIDSMVALELIGDYKARFDAFAAEKHTNVKNKNIYQEKLTAYYNQKRQENEDLIRKMRGEYLTKTQQQLQNLIKASAAAQQQYQAAGGEAAIPAVKEDEIRSFQPNPAINSSYAVSWYEPGWMNIDGYIHLLEKGSKEVPIVVNHPDGRVYQSLNTLKVIVPLTANGGTAKAMFPKEGQEGSDQMRNAFCIGISRDDKGISYAEKRYDPYLQGEVQLDWVKLPEKEFYKRLKALPDANPKYATFLKSQEAEIKRRQQIQARQEVIALEAQRLRDRQAKEKAMMERLLKVAGSCGMKEEQMINNMGEIVVETAAVDPSFPGGKSAMNAYLSQNLRYPQAAIDKGITGKCWVRFKVNTDGSIQNIKITRSVANCPECDSEVIRVIQAMPKWNPAKDAAGNVIVSDFDLPVKFDLSGVSL